MTLSKQSSWNSEAASDVAPRQENYVCALCRLGGADDGRGWRVSHSSVGFSKTEGETKSVATGFGSEIIVLPRTRQDRNWWHLENEHHGEILVQIPL